MTIRTASSNRSALLAVVTTLLMLSPVDADAQSASVFTFVGGGWGHSVGLSQYGGFGMSKEGYTSDQIISHYYTGTSVQVVHESFDIPLWVNVDVAATATFSVQAISGPGVPVMLSNGTSTISVSPPDSFTVVSTGGGNCLLTAPGGTLDGPCTFDGEWDGWQPDFASPSTLIQIPGCANTSGPLCKFARGTLHIRPHSDPGQFNVVIEIDPEDYTLGIAEMPYSWGSVGGMAALEAQAIAARSYALRSAFDRGNPAALGRRFCWCHVQATTADQSYVGFGYGALNWTNAVRNTDGEVVTHPLHTSSGNLLPIKSFYASSTYGWTESYADGFGGTNQAHLQAVDDHWSANPDLNPFARWSKDITASELATILTQRTSVAMSTVTSATITKCSGSGAALEIRFTGGGNSVTVRTRDLRGWLGLRSMQVHSVGSPPPQFPTCPSPLGTLPTGSLPSDLVESVGLHEVASGIFRLHVPGASVLEFYYGDPADIPFSGDWDCDGITSLGLYRVSAGFLFLRNQNSFGVADIDIYYGLPGDRPIAGDWDHDGCETIGIYRPSNQRFYLRNENSFGVADVDFLFGVPGDLPLAGDWDGDGIDTVGVYRPSSRTVYLTNSVTGGSADVVYFYDAAQSTDRVIVGDWDGDGIDTLGLYRPATATFYLRDDYEGGPDYIFVFGIPQLTPITGLWG